MNGREAKLLISAEGGMAPGESLAEAIERVTALHRLEAAFASDVVIADGGGFRSISTADLAPVAVYCECRDEIAPDCDGDGCECACHVPASTTGSEQP